MNKLFVFAMSGVFYSVIGLAQSDARFLPQQDTLRRVECDETCRLEYAGVSNRESGYSRTQSNAVQAGYAVVSPVGLSTIEPIEQVARLETLAGKRIALVGVSFMTHITHDEIRQLILQNYPSAQIEVFDKLVDAGGRILVDVRQFDAVIAGNGGCGLCTPKELRSCIEAEKKGVPSVMVAAPGFAEQARYTALNNGVPVMRVALYPGAFASHTESELRANVRNVLWPQIVGALTQPISAAERAEGIKASRGDVRDDVFYGTYEEVLAYFNEQGWNDGLPMVLPTFEKVNEFLRFTDLPFDETVAELPVAHRQIMVWHVAVNGVMSGCKPEYMPLLIAITRAMGQSDFRRTLSSTHAWMPYCWLNGPVARQLGFDAGQGEINASANRVLGRFLDLAMMNLAGYYVKTNRMGTFGYPMAWCLVEDEGAASRVGWKPYHVRQGFNEQESTVTLASALLWGNNMAPSTTNPAKMMELLAWDISERCQFALGSGKQFTYRTVLMTEPVAGILAQKYTSPQHLEQALISASRRPLKERAFANFFANPGGSKDGGPHNLQQYSGYLKRSEQAAMTPTPAWYDTEAEALLTIPTMQENMTAFIITGDTERNKLQTMPGGGYATVRIELPAHWNDLMEELGYRPLEQFVIPL